MIMNYTVSVALFISLAIQLVSSSRECPVTDDINVVYSIVNGVGPASKTWVEDLLWWWKSTEDSLRYIGLTSKDIENCDLSNFRNLRVFINPGGNTYDQLVDLGPNGTQRIKDFIYRDQNLIGASAYVGFCAGGYLAAHDYIWEGTYEGVDYYELAGNPPLSFFPHTVEGSIVDINDDQFGDQMGSKFRTVNVSNGHVMLYYGGSTFGWNGVPDYNVFANQSINTIDDDIEADPELEVLIYYSDFYGYHTVNIPAAWRYRTPNINSNDNNTRYNILLTSVHPEADNCTESPFSDCPPAGTLSESQILQNRAWLCEYINQAAATIFQIPTVPIAPIFDTTAPHVSYPTQKCYERTLEEHMNKDRREQNLRREGADLLQLPLFCDDFEAPDGSNDEFESTVPPGLSPNFQRNQTSWQFVRPWNTSYIKAWNDGTVYTDAYEGTGYAVNVPESLNPTLFHASITTKPFQVEKQCFDEINEAASVFISYAYIAEIERLINGFFTSEYSVDGGQTWQILKQHGKNDELMKSLSTDNTHVAANISDWRVEGWNERDTTKWQVFEATVALPLQDVVTVNGNEDGSGMQLRFVCGAGQFKTSFCAVDSLFVYCGESLNGRHFF